MKQKNRRIDLIEIDHNVLERNIDEEKNELIQIITNNLLENNKSVKLNVHLINEKGKIMNDFVVLDGKDILGHFVNFNEFKRELESTRKVVDNNIFVFKFLGAKDFNGLKIIYQMNDIYHNFCVRSKILNLKKVHQENMITLELDNPSLSLNPSLYEEKK